jgi:hypothetical protein
MVYQNTTSEGVNELTENVNVIPEIIFMVNGFQELD